MQRDQQSQCRTALYVLQRVREACDGGVLGLKLLVAGEPATGEARLSAALPSAVTIPLTLADGTAGSSDYGSLSGIAIAAGATSGSGQVSTTRDGDQEYEWFSVALDTAACRRRWARDGAPRCG